MVQSESDTHALRWNTDEGKFMERFPEKKRKNFNRYYYRRQQAQDTNSDDQLLQWEIEPSNGGRYGTTRRSNTRDNHNLQKEGHIYQKPSKQGIMDKTNGNADSLNRRQEMERIRLLKSDHLSADRLPTSERSLLYRQLYGQERSSSSRRSSFSKSSKSLNRNYMEFSDKTTESSRIYEEIKNKSSESFPKLVETFSERNDGTGIYTKISTNKKTRSNEGFGSDGKNSGKKEMVSSNPTTPKYRRKIEKRSSSLPRRKISTTSIQKSDGVTHTDFPYYDEKLSKTEESPITPNLTNRRSTSYENVNFEDDFMKKLSTKSESKTAAGKCSKDSGKEKKIEETDVNKFKPITPIYNFEDGCQDMTSLTSSGYDTQTNSIVSTSDQIPYSLKLNKNYLSLPQP